MAVFYNIKGTTYNSFEIGLSGPTLYQGNFVPSAINSNPNYVQGSTGDLFIKNETSPAIFVYNNNTWLQKADWLQNGTSAYYLGQIGVGTTTTSSGNAITISGNMTLPLRNSGIYFSDGTFQATAAIAHIASGSAGYVQFNDGSNNFGSDINFYWDNTNKRLGIGTTTPISQIQYESVTLECCDSGTSTTNATVIDTFPVTLLRSAHYYIQVTDEDSSQYHVTQITVVHDGLNAFKSEYNILVSVEKLGEFTVQVQYGQCNLIFTAYVATHKTMKVSRTAIAI